MEPELELVNVFLHKIMERNAWETIWRKDGVTLIHVLLMANGVSGLNLVNVQKHVVVEFNRELVNVFPHNMVEVHARENHLIIEIAIVA